MTHPFKRPVLHEAWDRQPGEDTYDKPWNSDVTARECLHSSGLGEAGTAHPPRFRDPTCDHRKNLGSEDLPPLMGHRYRVRGAPVGQITEWRCQQCGVLWEENRANPQWCGALGGVT